MSEELNASVTPVRDALHRLTGERLVDAPRHEGFRVPMMTETMLRQLYAWHLDLLLLALMKRAELPAGVDAESGASGPLLHSALFAALARATGNPEHVVALEALSEKLEPVQRLEAELLDEIEAETADIMRAIDAQDRQALRRSLIRYHRRRQRAVPELLALLHEPRPAR